MKKIILLALLLSGWQIFAEAPADSIIFEAESFKVTGDWQVKPHFPSWYSDRPSGGKFLAGHTKKSGVAKKSVKISAGGKYNLNWRYLDVLNYPAPYKVTVSMNGSTLAEAVFNAKSQRASAAAQKKYGKGFAKFMWEKLEFVAPGAGEIEITLTKLPGKTLTAQGTRHLDLFLLTSDVNYKPSILDLNPLYVQIRMLPEQPRPVAVHIFGRLSRGPHYPPHMNINKKGLFVGAYKGLDGRQKDWLGAGDASPWVKLSPHLTYHGTDRITFDARTGYKKPEAKAFFEVLQHFCQLLLEVHELFVQ